MMIPTLILHEIAYVFFAQVNVFLISATFKDDPQERQVIFGSVSSYSVQLPVGPDYDNHSMEIFVRIADVYGAAVDFRTGTIQVK